MKTSFAGLLLSGLLLWPSSHLSAQVPEDAPIHYITQYQLAGEGSAVYGLFDLGSKSSVKIVYPSMSGGKLKLTLHGRFYTSPVPKPFKVTASFEDLNGNVFQESPVYAFTPAEKSPGPRWFSGLENVVGLFGGTAVEITVPPGTSVVNLIGDAPDASETPNQLVGYVSHIELPEAPQASSSNDNEPTP